MGTVNTRNGLLFFDFRYRGVRCREYTKLLDNTANAKRGKMIMERIEAEIILGSFSYEEYFPNSKLVTKFREHDRKIETVTA
jgi:integrase